MGGIGGGVSGVGGVCGGVGGVVCGGVNHSDQMCQGSPQVSKVTITSSNRLTNRRYRAAEAAKKAGI